MNSILIFFLNFTDYRIGMFSLADCALIALICFALQIVHKVRLSRELAIYISIIFLGTIGAFFLNVNKEYFSIVEYLASFVKLVFYILAMMLIPDYLIVQKVNIIKIIRAYLYIAVSGALLQLIIVQVFGVESWPLYSLGGHLFGIGSPDTMLVNNGLIRARGFYTEPAAFAVGITLAFLVLLYKGHGQSWWRDHLFYVVGILAANSFSGYGMAAMIYAIYLFRIGNQKELARTLRLILPGVAAVVVTLMFNGYLRGRLINLFALKDKSGVVRTVGGFHFLGEIPPYGVGLGNQSLYYHSLILDASEQIWYSGSGEFYNIILVSVITMGYVGAVGLLLYQLCILKREKRLFFSLLVTHFASGRLFTPSLWVFLILCLAVERTQKQGAASCVKRRALSR